MRLKLSNKNTTCTTRSNFNTMHICEHITQHVNNLDDPMQQQTVYNNEVDESLFTTDTTTPCDYNIGVDMPNLNNSHKNKSNTIPSRGIHSKSKHKYRDVLMMLTSNIMILIMVMHSLLQKNIQCFYNKNYKILTGVYMIP